MLNDCLILGGEGTSFQILKQNASGMEEIHGVTALHCNRTVRICLSLVHLLETPLSSDIFADLLSTVTSSVGDTCPGFGAFSHVRCMLPSPENLL